MLLSLNLSYYFWDYSHQKILGGSESIPGQQGEELECFFCAMLTMSGSFASLCAFSLMQNVKSSFWHSSPSQGVKFPQCTHIHFLLRSLSCCFWGQLCCLILPCIRDGASHIYLSLHYEWWREFHPLSIEIIWAAVVAQLAKRSLPTPEIRRSNPNIVTNFQIYLCQLLVNLEKTKIYRKRGQEWPIKKIN